MAIVGLSAIVYLDHNVDPALATELRSQGFDTVVPREIGMEKASDEEHLRRAASEGRVLITYDLRDFPRLAESWFRQGKSHSGILLAEQPPRLPFGQLVHRVLAMLDSRTAEEFVDQVIWLQHPPA